MRGTRALLLLVLLSLVALPPAAAEGKRKRKPPTATARILSAEKQTRKLPRTTWSRGRRTAVLKVFVGTRKALRKKKLCTALRGADRARNALATKGTWKRRKVPKTVSKKINPTLTKAEATLRKKTGTKCSRAAKTKKKVKPHKGGSGFKPVPALRVKDNEQGEEEGPLPVGRRRAVTKKVETAAIGRDPHQARRSSAARDPFGVTKPPARALAAAAGPLTFFRSSDVGVPPRTNEPMEPTTAVGKNVAWFTGNVSVGFSLDGGGTWTRVDPSTILPDPAGMPFCCDQLVSYSPQENLFVWLMQYWCTTGTSSPATNSCKAAGTGSNMIRIAVASPESIRANKNNIGAAWTYWDLPPSSFGLASTAWFDRSDISTNASFLDWSVDVLRNGSGGGGSLLARIPLYQLKNRGTIQVSWARDTGIARFTAAQGTQTSWTYFAGASSASRTRIYEWAPNSGTLFPHDIDHQTVPTLNGAINGSDGTDWYSRWGIFPGAVESAVWTGNRLIVSQGSGRDTCASNCGTPKQTTTHVFDHPAAYISRFDTNAWTLAGERWLWNGTTNFAWPFMALSGDGTVGITFLASDDNHNPVPVAGFLNEEQFVYALGEGRPQGAGDYYSLRPGRTAESFVIPVRNNERDSDGVTRTHWRYIEFGAGQPPSVNAPSVFITSPKEGRKFFTGAPIAFNATASDIEDGDIPEYAIVWRVDGTKIGTGSRVVYSGSAPGDHTATVTATDGGGLSRTATVHYTVENPGGPTAAILSPDDNQIYFSQGDLGTGEYKDLQFIAQASDPNNKPLTYSWTDTVTESVPGTTTTTNLGVVSTQLSPVLRLRVPGHNCGFAAHNLTLTVSNGTDKSSVGITENVKTANCIK